MNRTQHKKDRPRRGDYISARDILLANITPIDTETVPLDAAAGRILAEDLFAVEAVPSFDRSAYDGYALRAADTQTASKAAPVTLRILEEVPAGTLPTHAVTVGTATKILTGAPMPKGADTVVPYELTRFTDADVTLYAPVAAGRNIVRAGEDIAVGTRLCSHGTRIDAGLAGALAAQGKSRCTVYRAPVVGLLSTGSEIIPADAARADGKTRDTNVYSLAAALTANGFVPKMLGIVPDDAQKIRAAIEAALPACDAILCTGGVSAGDYDVTPIAMQQAGAKLLVHGVALKPGMACAYAMLLQKPLCALSGNPASAYTNFYAIVLPALKALAGSAHPVAEHFPVTLLAEFKKPSLTTRLLRGTLDLSDGTVGFRFDPQQGNAVLSSAMGCNAFCVIPAGSGPVPAGTRLSAFMI